MLILPDKALNEHNNNQHGECVFKGNGFSTLESLRPLPVLHSSKVIVKAPAEFCCAEQEINHCANQRRRLLTTKSSRSSTFAENVEVTPNVESKIHGRHAKNIIIPLIIDAFVLLMPNVSVRKATRFSNTAINR